MFRFNKSIQVLFLTMILSWSGAKITPIAIQADVQDQMICQCFYPEPPEEGDGGSRVYQSPIYHYNLDDFLFQV